MNMLTGEGATEKNKNSDEGNHIYDEAKIIPQNLDAT